MFISLAQAMTTVSDSVSAVVPAVDSKTAELIALSKDPVYGLQMALYTWLLASVVALSVAIIMKLLYLHMKRVRIKEAAAAEINVK